MKKNYALIKIDMACHANLNYALIILNPNNMAGFKSSFFFFFLETWKKNPK